MPLYIDDLLGGTMHLGAEEFGAYMLLLTHQWQCGAIEDNKNVIERVARCEYGHLTRVLSKFERAGGQILNRRMEHVRNERINYMRRAMESGTRGADIRWGDRVPNGVPNRSPNGNPYTINDTSPSPSPSPLPNPSPDARALLSSSGRLGVLAQSILDARQEFAALQPMAVINCLRGADPATIDAHVAEFVADCANMLEPPRNPLGLLRGYLRGRSKPTRGQGYEKKQLGKSRLPNE